MENLTIQEVAQKISLDKADRQEILRLAAEAKKQAIPVHHAHGLNGFDNCLYCESEINEENPGKLVIMGARREHVCNPCFIDKDYQ